MSKSIGILTAGGDSPGLNAAIRGITKAAIQDYGIKVVGILDGFRGLVENRTIPLEYSTTSGVLTRGGTILGTSRDKPRKMLMGGKIMDMTEAIVANYHANHLDCLVCLGGGGTMKNALRLQQAGLNIVTLPKTIDNDVALTETTFGFDTALGIAEAFRYATENPERYDGFFEADGTLKGPGFDAEMAEALPEHLR